MQLNNKKVILIISLIIGFVLIAFILFKMFYHEPKKEYDYYFTYEANENLISQSLYIYDKKGKLISNYYVFDDDKRVIGFALNDAEFATISIPALDLSTRKEITITLDDDEDIYNYRLVGLKD